MEKNRITSYNVCYTKLLRLFNSCVKTEENGIEKKISDLISEMTLEEKIGQLSQPVLHEITDSVDQMIIDGKVGSFRNNFV